MDTDITQQDDDPLTERIIGCAYTAAKTLGAGFLEKAYEDALAHILRKAGLKVEQQRPVDVSYGAGIVGIFVADLLVEKRVIVEVKTVKQLDDILMARCANYLKAAGVQVCLLINFGLPEIEIKRIGL